MPYKSLSDFDEAAKYQKNLKAGLAEAKAKSLPVTLYDSFPFKEQTAPLLVVGKLDSALAKKIVEKGAKKLGDGECRFASGQMLVKGTPGLNKANVEKALKIGKSPLDVRALATDEDLQTVGDAAEHAAVQQDGKTAAAGAASVAQSDTKTKTEPAYLALIKRFDVALPKLAGTDEEAKVQALKAKIVQEYDEQDFVQVKALMGPLGKALEGVEARIIEREKQQKEFEAKRAALQAQYDKTYDTASAEDQKALSVAWAQADKDAQARSFGTATAKMSNVETLIRDAGGRTLEAKRQRLTELKAQAGTILSSPTAAETDALSKAQKEVEGQLGNGDFAKAETALNQFEQATQRLANARRDKKQAETLAKKVEDFWIDQEWNFLAKTKGKVNGELPALRKELAAGDWKKAIKRATGMMNYMSADLQAQQGKAAAAQAASQAFAAALNQTDTEDQGATAYGDSTFSSGMLRNIWSAVKAVRTASPANGSIPGVHSLSDVAAAIGTWRGIGNSGILTNFHVPGGRPQAKWAKDFTRPEVQANFCCYWRTLKVNIHVNVELKSYFDRYGDEEDWTLIPHHVRASLGR